MFDLNIDELRLRIEHAAGQEHRIRPITTRAIAILGERMGAQWPVRERVADSRTLPGLNVPPVSLDLQRMSDEQAAGRIAGAVLEALALKLRA